MRTGTTTFWETPDMNPRSPIFGIAEEEDGERCVGPRECFYSHCDGESSTLMSWLSTGFVLAFAEILSTARMECNLLSFEADHGEESEIIFVFSRRPSGQHGSRLLRF